MDFADAVVDCDNKVFKNIIAKDSLGLALDAFYVRACACFFAKQLEFLTFSRDANQGVGNFERPDFLELAGEIVQESRWKLRRGPEQPR